MVVIKILMTLATRTESLSLYCIVGRQAVFMGLGKTFATSRWSPYKGYSQNAKETYKLGKQWYEVRAASI